MIQVDQGFRVCIVTGANTGLGYETARQVALKGNYRIILGCRSKERGQAAVDKIQKELDNKKISSVVELGIMDLESLDSVHNFAIQFKARNLPLNILVLNAGVLPIGSKRELTKDGFEKCMGVNHLGHFLLTLHLLECLRIASPSRVVIVSSMTYKMAKINFDDIHLDNGWNRAVSYANSKLANIYFGYEFHRRYNHLGISANVLEPGIVASDILKEAHWFIRIFGTYFMNLIGTNTEKGAKTAVYLASDPKVEGISGRFFENCKEIKPQNCVHDEFIARKVWDISCKLTNIKDRIGDINTTAIIKEPTISNIIAHKHFFDNLLFKVAAIIIVISIIFMWYSR